MSGIGVAPVKNQQNYAKPFAENGMTGSDYGGGMDEGLGAPVGRLHDSMTLSDKVDAVQGH